MNITILVGRLTTQPQLSYTSNNKPYCRFTLAVAKKFSKNREADFIDCIAWNKSAELIEKYVAKGHQLGVQGSIQTNSYQDKDGNNRKSVSVFVESIELINNPKTTRTEDVFNPTAYDEAFKGSNKTPFDFEKEKQVNQNNEDFDINEDDIPF